MSGETAEKTNLPSPLALRVRMSPVRSFFSVIVAPGKTAPVGSTTVPEIVPLTLWAAAGKLIATTHKTARNNASRLLLTLDMEGLLGEMDAMPGSGILASSIELPRG